MGERYNIPQEVVNKIEDKMMIYHFKALSKSLKAGLTKEQMIKFLDETVTKLENKWSK